MTTSWARSRASSFVMARCTCARTVKGLRNIRSAISWLDRPVATRDTISRSRGVSTASRAESWGVVSSGVARNRATRERVAAGESSVSPPAIVRTASASSSAPMPLPTKPPAPARSARATFSSVS